MEAVENRTGDEARSSQVNILGVQIDNLDRQSAMDRISTLVSEGHPTLVMTPNVDHVVNLQNDTEFRSAYGHASLVLADGMPLMWAAKFLGTPIQEKLSGSDIFPDLCRLAAEHGFRVFFMGGREGAAAAAAERMKQTYPELNLVGVYSPPLGFESDPEERARIDAMLLEAKPDVLLLGLGSPKQEKWADQNSARLGIPVTIGIGITFEYTAGMVKRAPLWMQHAGLEWSYRLMSEPARLWKRYLVNDPKFFWLVLKQRMARSKPAITSAAA